MSFIVSTPVIFFNPNRYIAQAYFETISIFTTGEQFLALRNKYPKIQLNEVLKDFTVLSLVAAHGNMVLIDLIVKINRYKRELLLAV